MLELRRNLRERARATRLCRVVRLHPLDYRSTPVLRNCVMHGNAVEKGNVRHSARSATDIGGEGLEERGAETRRVARKDAQRVRNGV